MNLIIDQGNTNIKFYYFNKNKIVADYLVPVNNKKYEFLDISKVEKCIFSSVSGENEALKQVLVDVNSFVFTASAKLPIVNKYKSATIGLDRLAAVVGANSMYPEKNILIIDVGSAVTYDFINKKAEYLGGNISPGVKLRYNALNDYTVNLPKYELQNSNVFLADNTKDAIIAGVQNGLLFEIEHYIEKLLVEKPDLITIITGGDANFFAKKIKYIIFAQPNLVAIGLNEILNYNF